MSTTGAETLASTKRTIISPEERTVRTSIPTLDAFVHGIRPFNIMLIDSSDRLVFDLTHIICINAVHDLDQDVVWVDGGNSINPYELGRICKRFGMPRDETLNSINIARAFTAHQLVSLIDSSLEKELDRTHAGTVIISCLPDLFLDKELRWTEAYQLMKRCVETLHHLTRDRGLVTLVTNHGLMKMVSKSSVKNLLYGSADEVLRIENASRALRISLVNCQRSMLYFPVPHNQTTLEEFMR